MMNTSCLCDMKEDMKSHDRSLREWLSSHGTLSFHEELEAAFIWG